MGDKENVDETGLGTELIPAFKSRTSRQCLILIPQMSNTGDLDANIQCEHGTPFKFAQQHGSELC